MSINEPIFRLTHIPTDMKRTKRTRYRFSMNIVLRTNHKTFNVYKSKFYAAVSPFIPSDITLPYPVEFKFTYYASDNRVRDLSNMCALIDKMITDVLVMKGILPDDSLKYIPKVTYLYGGKRDNASIDLEIYKYEKEGVTHE